MTGRPAVSAVAGFDDLYRSELASIIALTASLTGDDQLGVDLANEAMLRALRAWPAVGAMDRPGAWVRRVAINLAFDSRRRRRRERAGITRLEVPRTHPAPEPTDHAFWRAVRELPERQRAAVALHYLEDLPLAEVAAVLDVSVGTVKTSLFRARKALAVALAITDEEAT